MYQVWHYLLVVALCSSTVLGQDGVTTQKPETINLPVSSEPSSPKDISVKPIESTEPLNTTTSTTTTIKPTTSTTTTTTTTTTPKPTTTTPKPTTTTPKPTTTTPKPTPTPKPEPPKQGVWSYTENNVTCILVQFTAQLNVTYTNSTSSQLAYVIHNVPNNATVVDGSCNGTEQWLNISWPGSDSNITNSLLLVFKSNITTKNYALKNLNASLAPEMFPNSQFNESVELTHAVEKPADWQAPLATSYRCEPAMLYKMTSDIKIVAANITLSHMQEEAFRTTSDNKTFSAALECGGGDVPDAVPIAVGCALGGLVIVVLVAYLVGRRNSASRGYLSM